jgi:hypothetical protein
MEPKYYLELYSYLQVHSVFVTSVKKNQELK